MGCVPGQALVFLTHVESASVYRHFRRLCRETEGRLLRCFLCVYEAEPRAARGMLPADYRITPEDGACLLPSRHLENSIRNRGLIIPGFPDLAVMPVFHSPGLREYDYVWFVDTMSTTRGDGTRSFQGP